MKDKIIDKVGIDTYEYISKHINIEDKTTLSVSTTNIFNITNHQDKYRSIVNFSKLNNIRYLNKFFIEVNEQLEIGDIYIGCGETFTARKERMKINKIIILNKLYFLFEFIFLRIFPKIWGLKKIYFTLTRGRNRLLSKAEMLGRLVSCGFEILDFKVINGLLYFVVKKNGEPLSLNKPSYGPLYKMPRMGKNGKIIGVYKFRTMHPFAEYLHDYILKTNGYAESGKPADDFRLTPWGKFFRRYWLDEIPQLINVLKGELKLVGVRPISKRFFQDIPEDLQKLRLPHKPGCIPPYVALDKTGSVNDVLTAERQYLIDKAKKPYSTDVKYFISALYNIIVKRKKSA